ncbi:hypothetical protein D3C76_1066420 [compost metagenome]
MSVATLFLQPVEDEVPSVAEVPYIAALLLPELSSGCSQPVPTLTEWRTRLLPWLFEPAAQLWLQSVDVLQRHGFRLLLIELQSCPAALYIAPQLWPAPAAIRLQNGSELL